MAPHAEIQALRPQPTDDANASSDHPWRLVVVAIVIAMGTTLAVFLVHRTHRAEHEAILRMDPVRRRTMFDETRRSASLLCAQATTEPALSDRCFETTHFLLAFPECDDACVEFVRSHEHEATR